MDLSLNALIGLTYLIPIAIMLRKVRAPSFGAPEAPAVVRLDKSRVTRAASVPPDAEDEIA